MVRVILMILLEGWRSLGVSARELRLAHTLPTGQTFGWSFEEGTWVGALGDAAVALREDGKGCAEWRLLGGSSSEDTAEALLADYFQLDVELEPLYTTWAAADGRLARIAASLEGARVLRQDPVECLMSFICSSNNNIARISLMTKRLREHYGTQLCDQVYAFPTLEALAGCDQSELRSLGLGYRAPYVVESAKLAVERGGAAYLASLRGKPRDEVQAALLDMRGVGPKVADCVALFSLDVPDAVPVDTHVWRLARRDFDNSLNDCASITPTVYRRVGDTFRTKFGQRAGWAHSLLFAAELPAFADKIPPDLLADMRTFKQQEKKLKRTPTKPPPHRPPDDDNAPLLPPPPPRKKKRPTRRRVDDDD